jgi:hypothetical protein
MSFLIIDRYRLVFETYEVAAAEITSIGIDVIDRRVLCKLAHRQVLPLPLSRDEISIRT